MFKNSKSEEFKREREKESIHVRKWRGRWREKKTGTTYTPP
jgi:hypothetical protein